jgi:hypothetical protein
MAPLPLAPAPLEGARNAASVNRMPRSASFCLLVSAHQGLDRIQLEFHRNQIFIKFDITFRRQIAKRLQSAATEGRPPKAPGWR